MSRVGEVTMKTDVLTDSRAAASRAPALIAAEARAALVRLRAGDASIPAGRVRQDQALVLADRAAASGLGTN